MDKQYINTILSPALASLAEAWPASNPFLQTFARKCRQSDAEYLASKLRGLRGDKLGHLEEAYRKMFGGPEYGAIQERVLKGLTANLLALKARKLLVEHGRTLG